MIFFSVTACCTTCTGSASDDALLPPCARPRFSLRTNGGSHSSRRQQSASLQTSSPRSFSRQSEAQSAAQCTQGPPSPPVRDGILCGGIGHGGASSVSFGWDKCLRLGQIHLRLGQIHFMQKSSVWSNQAEPGSPRPWPEPAAPAACAVCGRRRSHAVTCVVVPCAVP